MLIESLKNYLQTNSISFKKIIPLKGDASFRQYYRIQTLTRSLIVMDAQKDGNIKTFCDIQAYLKSHQINVPEIYHQNNKKTLLILQDLGNTHLFDQRTDYDHYQKSIDLLIQMQQLPTQQCKCPLPNYNLELIQKEYELFTTYFIKKLLNTKIRFKSQFNTIFNRLYQTLPQTFVHRDYHSKNILMLNQKPFLIDFQDALKGPITYDLISILEDCYHQIPEKKKAKLYRYYHQQALNKKLIKNTYLFKQFKKDCAITALQRHLKAIGIFSRLYIRDKKPNYLQHIPRTLDYAIEESKLICTNTQEQLLKLKQKIETQSWQTQSS